MCPWRAKWNMDQDRLLFLVLPNANKQGVFEGWNSKKQRLQKIGFHWKEDFRGQRRMASFSRALYRWCHRTEVPQLQLQRPPVTGDGNKSDTRLEQQALNHDQGCFPLIWVADLKHQFFPSMEVNARDKDLFITWNAAQDNSHLPSPSPPHWQGVLTIGGTLVWDWAKFNCHLQSYTMNMVQGQREKLKTLFASPSSPGSRLEQVPQEWVFWKRGPMPGGCPLWWAGSGLSQEVSPGEGHHRRQPLSMQENSRWRLLAHKYTPLWCGHEGGP